MMQERSESNLRINWIKIAVKFIEITKFKEIQLKEVDFEDKAYLEYQQIVKTHIV